MSRMVSPTEWGAQVDYDTVQWGPWNPDKWVLHWGGAGPYLHEGEADEMALLRGWEQMFLDRRDSNGNPVYVGIAYNYAVGNVTGNWYRLRGENRSGATSGDIDDDGIRENHEAVAVVFMVGPGQSVSIQALRTFQERWAERQLPVYGHRDAKPTQCPGDEIYQWITQRGFETDPPSLPPLFEKHIEQWRPLLDWFIGPALDMYSQSVVNTMLCVMDAESNGDPKAVNARSGAAGLFQHMPHLWPDNNRKALAWYESVGVPIDDLTDRPSDPFDPVANIATTAWLLYAYSHGYWHWTPTHDGSGCGFQFPRVPTRMPGNLRVPSGPFPGVPGKPRPRKVRDILREQDARITELEVRVSFLEKV